MCKFNNTFDFNSRKAFTLIEILIVISVIGIISILALSLMRSIPDFRVDSFEKKYCELLDSAVTSAAAANGLESIKNTNLELLMPYLKGTLGDGNASIIMTDQSVITGGGESYTVTFPGGSTKTYGITRENGLDCVIIGSAE